MPTDTPAQTENTPNITIKPIPPLELKPILNTIVQTTSDNSACAKLNAHNLRYDAVCETQPKKYSIV